MLSLLGGICQFYIIFEGRLWIFYRNIFKNCFKLNLSGSWEFAGQMCAVLLLDAVSYVCVCVCFFFLISAHCFFSLFLSHLPWLGPLTSLPTDSTHLKLPGQSQLEALIPNILLQMIWDTVLHADPCAPKLCLGSSLFPAWLLHGVPMMKAQSLCFFIQVAAWASLLGSCRITGKPLPLLAKPLVSPSKKFENMHLC